MERRKRMNRWLRAALFTAGGAAIGFLYYLFFGCVNGCAITSDPLWTTLYAALFGFLASFLKDAMQET